MTAAPPSSECQNAGQADYSLIRPETVKSCQDGFRRKGLGREAPGLLSVRQGAGLKRPAWRPGGGIGRFGSVSRGAYVLYLNHEPMGNH